MVSSVWCLSYDLSSDPFEIIIFSIYSTSPLQTLLCIQVRRSYQNAVWLRAVVGPETLKSSKGQSDARSTGHLWVSTVLDYTLPTAGLFTSSALQDITHNQHLTNVGQKSEQLNHLLISMLPLSFDFNMFLDKEIIRLLYLSFLDC